MRRITCVKGEKWNCILFNKGGTAGLAVPYRDHLFLFGGGVCMRSTALKGTKDVLPRRKPSLAVAGIQYPFFNVAVWISE